MERASVPRRCTSDPLYARDGATWQPSALTRGPWDPHAQHGGAPAALVAGALEAMDESRGMAIVRLGYEFLAPVPLAPLTLERRVLRAGRRVVRLGASLLAGGREVCRVEALCVRRLPAAAGLATPVEPPPPPGTQQLGSPNGERRTTTFAGDAMEIVAVNGSYSEPGPATAWFRLRVPVAAGEETTPVQRVVAAADFANGISSVLDWGTHAFLNADLVVHLEREPEGEWVGVDAVTRVGPAGAGLSESVLYDSGGRIGRGVQALLVERPVA